MQRSILVPLDGSRVAEQALPQARRIARLTGASITLVRVVDARALRHDSFSAQQAPVLEARDYLRRAKRRLALDGFAVSSEVYYGDAGEGILSAADQVSADTIVMSSHGRSGVSRVLLGSVTERVVHASATPVLVVRAYHRPGLQQDSAYRKILAPLDTPAQAEHLLRYVARTPFLSGADILLLLGTHPVSTAAGEHETPAGSRGREELERAAQRNLGGQPEWIHVAAGDPAASILRVAEENGVDLIVMTTHGRVGLDRLLHGSVAGEVLHRANVPVLLLRVAGGALHEGVPVAGDARSAPLAMTH